MGVNNQLIIMVGSDIGYDTYEEFGGFDKFEKLSIDEDDKPNTGRMAIISDGMSGDYCWVGIPIYVSGRYEYLNDLTNNKEHNGMGSYVFKEPSKEQKTEIKEFIKSQFNKDVQVNVVVFIHYT